MTLDVYTLPTPATVRKTIPILRNIDPAIDSLLSESIDPNKEVFLVPAMDAWLLYAPLQGIVTLLSTAAAAKVRDAFNSDRASNLTHSDATIRFLAQQGLFKPSSIDRSTFEQPSRHWSPTHVTFSTTQKCTLRCTYCYAEGGRLDDIDIPRDIAKGAIDLIIKNAVQQNVDASINFLGEGEATASWKEFRWAIDYFRGECHRRSIKPNVDLSTNGIFPSSRIPYISENCDGLTFSLDGLAAVHDKYRLLPNGRGSFSKVLKTMQGFDALGKVYHIRSTISREALESLSSFVEFIGKETKCRNIQLEPIFDVKPVTSLSTQITHPDADAFVEAYRSARKVAARHGIEVYYSGSDIGRKLTFCSTTSAKNFLVTARGLVTSCNEVLQPTDPRAALFQYGQWDRDSQGFVVENSRIDKLGHLNSLEIKKCQGCMAKFNCAGDCYAKAAVANGDPWASGYTYRCEITRQLLKDNLLLSLLSGELGERPTSKWTTC